MNILKTEFEDLTVRQLDSLTVSTAAAPLKTNFTGIKNLSIDSIDNIDNNLQKYILIN